MRTSASVYLSSWFLAVLMLADDANCGSRCVVLTKLRYFVLLLLCRTCKVVMADYCSRI